MRPAWAAINLAALRHNLNEVRKQAGQARVLAILKANAYGHGLVRIAQALDGADAFGVARIDEALALRKAGIVKPIVLLEGFFNASELPVLAASGLQPVIHSEYQLRQLEAAQGLSQPLKVWLKVDTGMHRLGIDPGQAVSFYQRLQHCENVQGQPVLMSHFASADIPQAEQNAQQCETFEPLAAALDAPLSFSNSAALFAAIAPNDNWVRPGLALYGVSPLAEKTTAELNLHPVMSLQASVISVRDIKAGDDVGYGAAWRAAQATRIAVLAIGYGDGYPRLAPQGTPIWINGRCYPLAGRVSMDMLSVDLGPDSDVAVGDTGVLWGSELPVEGIAAQVGTIPYELLCNVARRVALDYTEHSDV